MFFVFYSPNLFFKRVIILPKFGEIRSCVCALCVRLSARMSERARSILFVVLLRVDVYSIFLNVGNKQATEQTNEIAIEQMNERPNKRQNKRTNERTNERTK